MAEFKGIPKDLKAGLQKRFETNATAVREVSRASAIRTFDEIFPVPKEASAATAAERVTLAGMQAREFGRTLLDSGILVRDRIREVRREWTAAGGREDELVLLKDLEDTILGAEVQGQITSRLESAGVDHENVEREIASGVRELIAHRVQARLSDPQIQIPDRKYELPKYFNEETQRVVEPLGKMANLLPDIDPASYRTEDPRYIEGMNAQQSTYTDAMLTRWVDGSKVRISKRKEFREEYAVTEITRDGSMAEQVKRNYGRALWRASRMIDRKITNPNEWYRVHTERDHIYGEPIARNHDYFFSHVYEGMNDNRKLTIGTNWKEVAGTPHPDEIESFARGKAIRTLVEGGDAMTYVSCLTQLPGERENMYRIARDLWDQIPTGERGQLAGILATVHADELAKPDNADLLKSVIAEIGSPEKVMQLRRELTDPLIEDIGRSVEASLMNADIAGIGGPATVNEFISAMEKRDRQAAREVSTEVARKMIYCQAMGDMVRDNLRVMGNDVIAGKSSLADMVERSSAMQGLLTDRRYTYNSFEPSADYPLDSTQRPLVFMANFARTLLSDDIRYIQDREKAVAEYFKHAAKNGANKAEMIALHNRLAVSTELVNEKLISQYKLRNDDPAPIYFHDTLSHLGTSLTEAVSETTVTSRGAYTHDLRGQPDQGRYRIYRSSSEAENSRFYQAGDRYKYIRLKLSPGTERVNHREQDVPVLHEDSAQALIPVFSQVLGEGEKIRGIYRIMEEEKVLHGPKALDSMVPAEEYRTNPVYTTDEAFKGEEPKALERAQKLRGVTERINRVGLMDKKRGELMAKLDAWEQQFGRLPTGGVASFARVIGASRLPAALQTSKAEIEASIREMVQDTPEWRSHQFDIAKLDERASAREVVRSLIEAQSQALASEITAITSDVPDARRRAKAFLGCHSKPPFSGDVEKYPGAESIWVPNVKRGNVETSRMGADYFDGDLKFAEENSYWGDLPSGLIVRPLSIAFIGQQASLAKPQIEAVGGIRRKLAEFPGLPKVSEALTEFETAVTNSATISSTITNDTGFEAFRGEMRLYLTAALNHHLDGIDQNTLNAEAVATVEGGVFVPEFTRAMEDVRRVLEKRKPQATLAEN